VRVRALSFLAVVSADSMVVGSVGPWATGPHFELSGLSSNIRQDPSLLPGAGRTVLGLALAGCVGFVLTRRHRTAGWFPAGLGLVATAMSVDHIRTAFSYQPFACPGGCARAHVGWGLVLATAGSVVFALAGIGWIALVPGATTESLLAALTIGAGLSITFAFRPFGFTGELILAFGLAALLMRAILRLARLGTGASAGPART
jgi:hypothetical protein